MIKSLNVLIDSDTNTAIHMLKITKGIKKRYLIDSMLKYSIENIDEVAYKIKLSMVKKRIVVKINENTVNKLNELSNELTITTGLLKGIVVDMLLRHAIENIDKISLKNKL